MLVVKGAIRIELQRAVRRAGDQYRVQGVLLCICIIDQHTAGSSNQHGRRAAFCYRDTVSHRHRRIILRGHANIDQNAVCTTLTITHYRGKAITAVVVTGRGISPATIAIHGYTAMRRITVLGKGQWITIHIGGQQLSAD